MSSLSAAVTGMCSATAQSFAFAFTGTAADTPIAAGGYELCADQDCYVKLTPTTGLVAATALPGTQPAVTAANATIRCYANQPRGFDVPGSGYSISVIRVATSGTLTVNGPFTNAASR